MKNKTSLMAAMAAVIGGAVVASGGVHAQTKPLEVWQPPQQEEADPAKRVPQAPAAEATSEGAPPQGAVVRPQAYAAAPRSASHERGRGGFFLGVQGGKGRVYEDVDQSALLVNAGYRWQAGDVTLIGIELAGGELDDERHGEGNYPGLDLVSLGANARFNFGSGSPVYALVRAGYWSAEDDRYGSNSDGGYVGGGLGVDFNRHFNMSVIYTTHVYATDYDWEDGYEINSADTLMLGAEVRF